MERHTAGLQTFLWSERTTAIWAKILPGDSSNFFCEKAEENFYYHWDSGCACGQKSEPTFQHGKKRGIQDSRELHLSRGRGSINAGTIGTIISTGADRT
jgi:hypothetical protein